MRVHIHETVQRLLELESLGLRLRELRRNFETTASVEALIESLCGSLPLPVLLDHQRLSARGGPSVAEVRENSCSVCGAPVARPEVACLRRGLLRHCERCGCYLYLVESEPVPDPFSKPVLIRKPL